ncbi:MAG TPA: hypothetical protein VK963_04835 [Candidatus Saccharimonadales bacterium]|nr:hypothetical protein [Candidatus Saccharimonadales bacterium]
MAKAPLHIRPRGLDRLLLGDQFDGVDQVAIWMLEQFPLLLTSISLPLCIAHGYNVKMTCVHRGQAFGVVVLDRGFKIVTTNEQASFAKAHNHVIKEMRHERTW